MRVRHGACAWLFLVALVARPFPFEHEPFPFDREPLPFEHELERKKEPEKMRLMCVNIRTVDERGVSRPAQGEALITVQWKPGSLVLITKEGFEHEYSGTLTEEEILGWVTYRLNESYITERIVINRFSGRMTSATSVQQKDVLMRYGECRQASKRRF